MTKTSTRLLLAGLLFSAGLFALGGGAALAQQAGSEADVFAPVAGPAANGQDAPATQPTAKTAKKAKVAATAKPVAAAPAAAASSGDVDQRLQQLEEQIADMQVVVGTLESTGKGRPAAAAPAGASLGGDADVRLGRLETQMQALGAQVSDIANELHGLEAKLQNGAVTPAKAPTVAPRPPAASPAQPPAGTDADATFGDTTVIQGATPAAPNAGAQTFNDVSGAPKAQSLPPLGAANTTSAPQNAALTPPTNDPQIAYDLAYGFIMQQDYAGAEGAFRDFIGRFAQSPLASNAHYWLGQTFYARGQYKQAADAFLKGYKTYRTGQKAPDSLLKVAMSLSRLGQKDLACSAFTALDGEFPNASAQIKHLEQSERERAGC